MRCLLVCDPYTLKNLGPLPGGIDVSNDSAGDERGLERVICWGTDRTEPDSVPSGHRGASRQLRVQTAEPALAVNGLTHIVPSIRLTRSKGVERHRLFLFDLHVFGHDVFTRGRWRTYQGPARGREALAELARRAIHCLHWDAGVVDLWVTKARWSVVRVVPGVPLAKRHARAMSDAISHWWDTVQQPREAISLGADPEFVMHTRRTGTLLRASRFFRKDGEIGWDSILGRPEISIGELRPEAGRAPEMLVNRLREAIARAKRQVGPQIGFRAGSMPFRQTPIGGHIHFRGVPFTSEILRTLDTYLAIPVFLIEVPESARQRRQRYGFLGDARRKPHGGFEYRTLPSWLVDPAVASAVLCLAVVTIMEAHRLRRRPFADVELQRAFYMGEKEPFYKLFPALWDEIRSTFSYAAFAEELALFPRWISKRQVWSERSDMGSAWATSLTLTSAAPPVHTPLQVPRRAEELLPANLDTAAQEHPHSLASLRSALSLFGTTDGRSKQDVTSTL